jgi:serine/threonine protein kinase
LELHFVGPMANAASTLTFVAAARRLFLKVYESKSPPPMDKAALDPQLYSLLVDCFTREPENRPSAAQLKNHSFVQQGP